MPLNDIDMNAKLYPHKANFLEDSKQPTQDVLGLGNILLNLLNTQME